MTSTNYALLTDLYELTMANGYFLENKKDQIVYFDLYFRKIPDSGGYAVFAGLEEIINYIENLKFTEEDIAFLESKNIFDNKFLDYLKDFKFAGNIYAFKEGTVMFPNEPIIIVKAKLIEAQIIETFLLQTVNHQSLIATKAARINYAAKGKTILEMGARRAHGASSSVNGARAAYISGVSGTSNVLADKMFKVPSGGTMAHSWVQIFENEYEAFKAYAKHYPNNTTFLVDTYDTLKSGVPNAIKAIKEILLPINAKNYAIRIDSGDLTYLSKEARKALDSAGLKDCKIVVSNSLDERLINTLLNQGAPIDIFGVGERLITAKSDPVFGSVYKLVAAEKDGIIIPKIKISDNPEKITTPHYKSVYRIYSDNKAESDLITLEDESIDTSKPLTVFDPHFPWKTKTFTNYKLKNLLEPIFINGDLVYQKPSLLEVRDYAKTELTCFWDEIKRFDNPHKYYVDLSKKLWDIKQNLITTK